jgi:hypothetical protein
MHPHIRMRARRNRAESHNHFIGDVLVGQAQKILGLGCGEDYTRAQEQ